MRGRFILGLLAALGLPAARATDELPWRVQADLEMVAVPMAEGLRLLPRLRHAASFPEAWARVQALVTGGEAEVLGWPTVETVSGAKAVSESLDGVSFGTEYEPPAIPGDFFRRAGPPTLAELFARSRPFDVPTAFETRNAGPTLEIEPTVDPQTHEIYIELNAQYVELIAMEPAIGARAQRQAGDQIQQPRFGIFSIRTSLILSGGRVLLQAFHLESPQPRLVFFLLHATAKSPLPAQP